jgi:hypothetical protein
MGPWNGTAVSDGLPNNTSGSIEPWTPAGGQLYAKPGNDRSVTSPPFYDTAPLTIPSCSRIREMVVEIPWYPPSPAKLGNATDPLHVCLIARIETSITTPFGMTTAETSDISFNTQRNNNIAWRNVSVVDQLPRRLQDREVLDAQWLPGAGHGGPAARRQARPGRRFLRARDRGG